MQKTIKKNQDIFINFGGFYNSIHETQIENLIENFENDNDNFNARFCEVDFFKTKINYSKHYLKSIEQFLFDNKINVKIEFLRIESPREYNFKTDKIVVNILKKYQKLILDFVKNNYKNELIELIKYQTTTRSDYHPFFNFNEIFIENKNGLLLEACLEIICDEINQHELPREFDLEYLKQ